MCITPGSQLFVRRDNSETVEGILPDLAKTKISPADHMNYNGGSKYSQSGYLSMFNYNPDQKSVIYRREHYITVPAAARAMMEYFGTFIHFFFINAAAVALQNLTEDNVHAVPTSGRTPTLFNTDACRPPARRNMDGDIVEYANRFINEFMLAGAWPVGTMVITERVDNSKLLEFMAKGASLDDICKVAQREWPCPKDPPGGSGGSGFGGGGIMT